MGGRAIGMSPSQRLVNIAQKRFLAGQGAVLVAIDAPVYIQQLARLVRCIIEKFGLCRPCPVYDGLQLGDFQGPLAGNFGTVMSCMKICQKPVRDRIGFLISRYGRQAMLYGILADPPLAGRGAWASAPFGVQPIGDDLFVSRQQTGSRAL